MVQERMNYEDNEDVENFADSGIVSAIGMTLAVVMVLCIIPFADGYRAVKRLNPIWKGLLVSAGVGVGVSLILFLIVYLLLEGIL